MSIHYSSLNPSRPEWLGGGQWMLRDLRDITIIIGRNGSGKSLLLRRLNEDPEPAGTHYASPERAGDVTFDQGLAQQELDPTRRGQGRRGVNLHQQYRRESISRVSALLTKVGLASAEGREVHQMRIMERISSTMADLLPEFQFRGNELAPFYVLDRLGGIQGQPTKVGDPNRELSSGETEVLTLALDLLTICFLWEMENQKQRVLLLDEPDVHLHPELQMRFAKFLVELIRDYRAQAIVATHNTTLMASLGHHGAELVGVIYLNNALSEQRAVSFSHEMRHITAVLGGHALIGPLFGAPLLLVEGDDDYQIWSQVPRQPGYRNVFAVLPCEGAQIKKYHDLLENLFASLRQNDSAPAAYILLDGDASVPTHRKQVHAKYLQLACLEAENLYLTDEVLAGMKLSWEDAKQRITAAASDFGEKEFALAKCPEWDRKSVDLKGLMEPLVEILDSRRLSWTTRVGKTIGQREPRNELEQFLGRDVISALWPPLR